MRFHEIIKFRPGNFSPRCSVCILLIFAGVCFPVSLPGQDDAADEDVEIVVNVLPRKGMKFDAEALYREDQEVIQGVLGSSQEDEVQALRILPTGHILVAGYAGSPSSKLADMPRLGCSEKGVRAGPFIGIADSHFREMSYVAFLPSSFSRIRHIEIAKDGSVFLGGESTHGSGDQGLMVMKLPSNLSAATWQASVRGDQMSGMTLLPDDTVVVAPNQSPFISRLKADGSDLIPFGEDRHFRTDAKNPQIYQKWWLDQEFPESGVSSATYHRGNAGGVGTTRDGNLVFLTSNFVRHNDGTPDFDPMLIKFTPGGEILWATHLLDNVPALSDHKSPHLYICPYSGDIIAAMRQHGHFADNLVVGERAYLKTDNWLTGNIMIGWIGRIDPETGRVKAGTMYFPDVGAPPEGGKLRANSLFPLAIRTDSDHNIYVTGVAAHKLETTLHAFQADKMGDSAFISVFNGDLTRLLYANLITGPGFSYEPTALLVTELGPLVATRIQSKGDPASLRRHLISSNTDKTNFLVNRPLGEVDILFSLLPSAPWKEQW
ncbi:MAG: hypothetical protein WD490_06655 [Opitutales bacterium]